MQIKNTNKEVLPSILLTGFFTAGLGFHLFPGTQKLVLVITDFTMLVTNVVVLFYVFRGQKNKALIYWSLITFLLTFLIELIGVRTGLIFGEYHYGETMQFQVFEIPVVIGMNWVILMLGSFSISKWMGLKNFFAPLISSLLVVGFDLIMEGVAIKLDYWQWMDNEIPTKNFIAWFFISFIFTSVLNLLKVNIENNLLKVYFFIQLGFFIFLRIFLP